MIDTYQLVMLKFKIIPTFKMKRTIDRFLEQTKTLELYQMHQQWRQILQCQDWNQVLELSLAQCQIDDANVITLLAKCWPNLEILWLNNNKMTAHGIKKLSNRIWPSLKALYLYGNQICDNGVQILLANLKNFTNISILGLNKCNMTNKSIYQMIDCDLSKIAALYLSVNSIGSMGIRHLTKVFLPQLNELCLNSCHLSADSMKYLNKGVWKKLGSLSINENKCDIQNIQNGNWQCLKYLQLSSGKLDVLSPINVLWLVCALRGLLELSKILYLYGIRNQRLRHAINEVLKQKYM